ncbi:MAG: DUF1549 and DUF1553 domain-containing protein [Acidobacteria bacterium]|nr:DUF1549 and DUF1553 domain-containing protein [Acidobacteriota bacterium]MCI0721516.1 DUF1549 and DUF1553 domain-containing protein [Acidobacteriota bacterium]
MLIQAVSHSHERLKMPQGGKLAPEEIAALKAWVKDGAVWPSTEVINKPSSSGSKHVIRPEQREFWAFQPVRKPPVPAVKDESWPKTAIDRFILAKLEHEALRPAGPADKRTLIRRATFDLIGLPPTPEEVKAFLVDESPDAFAKVVDRLLASPHYGERWGRHWLDLARYADAVGFTDGMATHSANAFRYRDWIVRAFTDDMPYDRFIKAQLVADLLPEKEREKMLPALGFHALGPAAEDDRVDVTTRTFLALTVGCAKCHDHKFDPIPTLDYYSLQGVFKSTEPHEYPLAPEHVVVAYKKVQQEIQEKEEAIANLVRKQQEMLAEILLGQTSQYTVTAWKIMKRLRPDIQTAAEEAGLDRLTLERWIKYLSTPEREHPYLKEWDAMMARGGGTPEEVQAFAEKFQHLVVAVNNEKTVMEDRNYVKLGGAAGLKDKKLRDTINQEFLEPNKWSLWRDIAGNPCKTGGCQCGLPFDGGIVFYGDKGDEHHGFYKLTAEQKIDRFLSGEWKRYLDRLRAELAELQKSLPPPYPFLHGYRDSREPQDVRLAIRGDEKNLGDVAPRRFLQILSNGEPKRFTKGSGRLELAEAIASPDNPLTARVMANRVWYYHFGQGIVGTPSNFGQLGERPTHPELLDYLASWFIESGWSAKSLHREMMLSATYAMSTEHIAANYEKDPDNRLHWRANLIQRLDAEALRDAILAVSGSLDRKASGPPVKLTDDHRRRTIYAAIGRTDLDRTLLLFDFPDPNTVPEQRVTTVGPLQRLFFLNSNFVMVQSQALAERLRNESGADDAGRIRQAYELLFARLPTESEIALGLDFLRENDGAWPQYVQVLLASSEFSSVN